MQPNQLKQALTADLQSLKRIDLEIIPAKTYYRALFLGWLFVYVLFLSTQSVACFFAITIHAWQNDRFERDITSMRQMEELTDSSKFRNPFGEEWDLEQKYPNANPKEINDMLLASKKARQEARLKAREAREVKYQKQREEAHLVQVAKMIAGILFSSLIFTVFLIGKVKNYVIFKHQLQERLQTGHYLAKKIKTVFFSFFLGFGLLSLLMIPIFDQDMTLFAGIASFIFSGVSVVLFIDVEASRIGVSVLATAITNYFNEEKKQCCNITD